TPAPALDLAGVAPQPLTGERRAAFDAYLAGSLAQFGVPGASVAVVENGAVVYARGFGVRALGGTQPVTADTRFMIGSVTKSMTSLMAATLVDGGWLSWDTPLHALLPDFRLADPALTNKVTVADSFCACTGIPRHDMPLLFEGDALTPPRLITSLANVKPTAKPGEKFQYSNQMYAIGGYAATIAAGGSPNDLVRAYRLAMTDRVLDPIGMTQSSFALEDVLASRNYAEPHAAGLDGVTRRVPVLAEDRFVHSGEPAGGLWSTASDMARYLQTQLAGGVAPDGVRVVSSENLTRTWTKRVAMPSPAEPTPLAAAAQGYAMGWITGAWHGQRLIQHDGSTLGFESQVAMLPDAGVGVVIVTNGGAGASLFTLAAQYRLFESLYDVPPEIGPLATKAYAAQQHLLATYTASLAPVDPTAVAPFLGRYHNPELGDVTLSRQDDDLLLDAGEIRASVRRVAGSDPPRYAFTTRPLDNPGINLALQTGSNGQPQLKLAVGPTGETYVFDRAAGT
ncbi:MAG TPA: serine hydrolase domain-containing protein, partial [Thermomicrobiales bacterium]|nr:serine hydrolase domain-containing protein [Thermomicrobiales bacterium]